jgi:hypothetical protein
MRKCNQPRRDEAIEKLCIFLKLLWEDTRFEPKPMNIHAMLHDLSIPYTSSIISIMRSKCIIERSHISGQLSANNKPIYNWQWVSTTEPNRIMADTLLTLCAQTRYDVGLYIGHRNPKWVINTHAGWFH